MKKKISKKSILPKKNKSKKPSTKKVDKTSFKITTEDKAFIHKCAEELIKKPNIKKYEFPVDKVEKVLTFIFRQNNGKIDIKELYKFSAGYCDKNDCNYYEVSAIISLMKRYHPNEMVVTTLAKGKKILVIGDVADEILHKSKIIWDEAHVSSAGAKIPIKLPLKNKLKCFDGDTIGDEIDNMK